MKYLHRAFHIQFLREINLISLAIFLKSSSHWQIFISKLINILNLIQKDIEYFLLKVPHLSLV